ncbi:MAG: hypothetical protein QM604_04855 [Microbacterium sp.]
MRFRVARSAHKHRIRNAHILAALINAGEPTLSGDKLYWIGVDDRGLQLEIAGFVSDEDPDLVIIIHAMPTTYPQELTEDTMSIDPTRYRIASTADATIDDIDLDDEVVTVGGKRYTDADAAQMESRLRGLSRGGHSLSGDGTHSPTVTTVLPREVRDQVKDLAAAEGMSVSKWLRRLIEREVSNHAA